MKRIVVPVDFSEQSIHAFRFALMIAEQSRGTVLPLHVTSASLPESSVIPGPPADARSQVVERKFARMNHEFNMKGIKVEPHIVSGGIHAAILDFIRQNDADLVVMGTKGASGMKAWMIGSNTEKIVRSSPVPVIAVKGFQDEQPIKDIVFPNTLDTENQEELIMKVKALQDFFKATLHIIWVNTPALFKPETQIRLKLQAFAKRFMLKDYTIDVFNYSNEEAGILEFTKQMNAGLIAMGTHGITGLARLIMGSIAEDVVNHVHYPVWTYCTKRAEKLATEEKEAWQQVLQ